MNESGSFSSIGALPIPSQAAVETGCAPGAPPPMRANPMSSIPPSLEPDSGSLRWIPESMALAGVPESRMLTRPPPPLPEGDFGDSVAPPYQSIPLRVIPESEPVNGVPESRPRRSMSGPELWCRVRGEAAVRFIAAQALKLVLSRRRLLQPNTCEPECEACLAPHLAKAEALVRRGMPIHFVLPSFPAKSPNPRKVIGALPDMAEVVALTFLQNLCTKIRTFYSPGARLTICSDGRVFSDLVDVSDESVSAYGRELGVILEQLRADALDVFALEDYFRTTDCDGMRGALLRRCARPLDALTHEIAAGGAALSRFNGIARFLFEDMLATDPNLSRTLVRKITKARAYQVIQRSDAWSALVEQVFPDALRLSIHPQPVHSGKIGIHLLETLDSWLTPWHATAVKVGGRYVLMKRYHAERIGAVLVHGGLRPSHFVADHIDLDLLRRTPEEREESSASGAHRIDSLLRMG